MQTAPILAAAVCLSTSAGAFAQIIFQERTDEAGLAEPLAGMMGHGGAWGDFDGDGRIDLFVGGFADRPDAEYAPAAGPVRNRLFRNLGGGKFADAGQAAVAQFARTSGAVFADLDGDGDLDLYVANNAKGKTKHPGGSPQHAAQLQPSSLFENRDGQFSDVSARSGACPADVLTARNVGVFDYDGDGRLDLFVVEDKFTAEPGSRLLRNESGLKFAEATAEGGLPGNLFGLGGTAADLNGDRLPDLFVPHSNRLFLSRGGGRYREAADLAETFAWEPLNGEDWSCGAAFGDLNRDGLLDLVLSIHGERARNRLFLNRRLEGGVPRFEDVTAAANFPAEVPAKCPHVEIQDFDNDGWPDIYFSAGWLEGGSFTPLILRHGGCDPGGVPTFAAPREVATPMVYFPAGPSGDYDNDGRLDLFLVNWFRGNRCRLLHNASPAQNHWLRVAASDKGDNRMGIGAKVTLFQAGKLGDAAAILGHAEISTGYGYASGQPAAAHFGLGKVSKVDLRVEFASGTVVEQQVVNAGQILKIAAP